MKKIVARHGASAVPYLLWELKHRRATFGWVLGHIEELGPDARESLPVLRSLANEVKPDRIRRIDEVIEKIGGDLEVSLPAKQSVSMARKET